jgi:hypothetical protein
LPDDALAIGAAADAASATAITTETIWQKAEKVIDRIFESKFINNTKTVMSGIKAANDLTKAVAATFKGYKDAEENIIKDLSSAKNISKLQVAELSDMISKELALNEAAHGTSLLSGVDDWYESETSFMRDNQGNLNATSLFGGLAADETYIKRQGSITRTNFNNHREYVRYQNDQVRRLLIESKSAERQAMIINTWLKLYVGVKNAQQVAQMLKLTTQDGLNKNAFSDVNISQKVKEANAYLREAQDKRAQAFMLMMEMERVRHQDPVMAAMERHNALQLKLAKIQLLANGDNGEGSVLPSNYKATQNSNPYDFVNKYRFTGEGGWDYDYGHSSSNWNSTGGYMGTDESDDFTKYNWKDYVPKESSPGQASSSPTNSEN